MRAVRLTQKYQGLNGGEVAGFSDSVCDALIKASMAVELDHVTGDKAALAAAVAADGAQADTVTEEETDAKPKRKRKTR